MLVSSAIDASRSVRTTDLNASRRMNKLLNHSKDEMCRIVDDAAMWCVCNDSGRPAELQVVREDDTLWNLSNWVVLVLWRDIQCGSIIELQIPLPLAINRSNLREGLVGKSNLERTCCPKV